MKKKNKTLLKLLFYFGGLIIMTLGVSLSVKSNLGVSPISSIPYTITVVFGMDLGIATILFSIVVVILQILLLRKQYQMINLLQIPIGVVFGVFLTLFGKMMALFPSPEGFAMQLTLMLVSTVFVALGVFLYVPAGFVPLPPEGILLAITKVTGIKFSTAKIAGDITMVVISLVTCLIALHAFGSIGIGTVVAALLVGTEVKWMTKFWGAARDRLLVAEDRTKIPEADSPLLKIMKKDVYTLKDTATVADALKEMYEKKVSGLPVVNDEKKLVGFISDGDIIRNMSSEHSLFVNSDSFEKIDFNSELKRILDNEVMSLANKNVITVNADDDLGEVCYILEENRLKKAPVMQGDDMIGIINASNIIKYAVSLM